MRWKHRLHIDHSRAGPLAVATILVVIGLVQLAWRAHSVVTRLDAAPAPLPLASAQTSLLGVDGLDLELHLWSARISIPWLRELPIRPGRRIIVTFPAAGPLEFRRGVEASPEA